MCRKRFAQFRAMEMEEFFATILRQLELFNSGINSVGQNSKLLLRANLGLHLEETFCVRLAQSYNKEDYYFLTFCVRLDQSCSK